MRGLSAALSIGSLSLAALAVVAAPPPPTSPSPAALAPPPNVVLMKVLSLGRHDAAADIAWLQTVQFIGAPHSERVLYAGMEGWIDLISDLAPRFENPYFHGGILLSTLPNRSAAASEIFAEAERNLVPEACRAAESCPLPDFRDAEEVARRCVPCPALVEQRCNWSVPLSGGYAAHFGELDSSKAARLFCESRRRGGPEYLTPFAARLTRQATSCKQLRADLGGVARLEAKEGGSELLSRVEQQLRILEHCERDSLKRAAQSFRFAHSRAPSSVDELLAAGLLTERPWVPHPSACWLRLARGIGFELAPCPAP